MESLPFTRLDDINVSTIYEQFSDTVILIENNRLDETDPEILGSNIILGMVRDKKWMKKIDKF